MRLLQECSTRPLSRKPLCLPHRPLSRPATCIGVVLMKRRGKMAGIASVAPRYW